GAKAKPTEGPIAALEAGTPSPVKSKPPLPATVVRRPVDGSTRRIRAAATSLIKTAPEGSTSDPNRLRQAGCGGKGSVGRGGGSAVARYRSNVSGLNIDAADAVVPLIGDIQIAMGVERNSGYQTESRTRSGAAIAAEARTSRAGDGRDHARLRV